MSNPTEQSHPSSYPEEHMANMGRFAKVAHAIVRGFAYRGSPGVQDQAIDYMRHQEYPTPAGYTSGEAVTGPEMEDRKAVAIARVSLAHAHPVQEIHTRSNGPMPREDVPQLPRPADGPERPAPPAA